MRRGLGSIVLAIGLLCAWGATFVYLSQLSLLKPGRLAQASTTLIHNSAVRGALTNALTTSLTPLLGSTLNIPTGTFHTIIDQAVANPAVQTAFAASMNQAQEHLLGASNGPIVLGGSAFSQVVAAGVVPFSSTAASTIAQQGISITIPGSALPNIGSYARNAHKIEKLLLSLAIICVIIALIIHPSRGSVIRRIGFWMIGMAFGNALIFWFIPTYLLPQIGFSWAQILAIVLRAVSGPATSFYVVLLGLGVIVAGLGQAIKKFA
ncbi:MAG: hypothetical protein ACP5O0_02685 [Acidimicrobiales bacterium]